MVIEELKSGITSFIGGIGETITEHPISTAVLGTAALGGATLGAVSLLKSSSKKRMSKTKRGRKRDKIFKSKQKHEKRYVRKRRYKKYGKKGWIYPKKSGKRRGKVYYARKTGQPYIILASGKAKFIKGKRRK